MTLKKENGVYSHDHRVPRSLLSALCNFGTQTKIYGILSSVKLTSNMLLNQRPAENTLQTEGQTKASVMSAVKLKLHSCDNNTTVGSDSNSLCGAIRLARSAVNRKVGGSSPPRDGSLAPDLMMQRSHYH